jgi:hypothetical protein
MPAWCALYRWFTLLCDETVILLAYNAVDNLFNIIYDGTVSVLASNSLKHMSMEIQVIA